MTCDNAPESQTAEGVCHVCAMADDLPAILKVFAGKKGHDVQAIRFCPHCCHWFCEPCWGHVFGRITGFVKNFMKKVPGCCGPSEKTS